MPLRDELLIPIPGANPAGVELRYDPLYDKIKEARREDDDTPQGEWQTARKTADWAQVIKLAKEALISRSKDLQLAVWLAEALLRREGFAGFRASLDMIVGMLEAHWDHLYPEIEDGDPELRAAPLEWLGLKLDLAVRRVPLDRAGHDWLRHQEARMMPSEAEASSDDARAQTRATMLEEGKLAPEELERGFQSTPKAWLKTLVADIDGTLESLQNLDDLSRERFGNAAPSYSRLRVAIEEVLRVAKQLLKRKLELEPDPIDGGTDVTGGGANATPPVSVPAGVQLPGSVGAQLTPQPTSREDAAARIASSARYLRQADPTNPASYLLLRGFRWGELRASGRSPDPRLLEAPATATRTQLKTFLLDGKWEALLEACEAVLATPQGRGWLDLQRYALTACQQLGSEYQIVGAAIRGALRSLLQDLPALVDMTLMDDTPTANGETRNWLATVVEPAEQRDASGEDGAGPVNASIRAGDASAAAMAAVRAGRTDRAITLLMREVASEKSKRGRFLVQTQLASIMVEAGHHAVAQPILEELVASVEAHRLEDWESGDVIARPLALLYQCLERMEGDAAARQALYLRICRLDPLQAIGFAQA